MLWMDALMKFNGLKYPNDAKARERTTPRKRSEKRTIAFNMRSILVCLNLGAELFWSSVCAPDVTTCASAMIASVTNHPLEMEFEVATSRRVKFPSDSST
jgi:hypothetical protein